MSKPRVQLKEVSALPISWLGESRLKSSLLLRNDTANRGNSGKAAEVLDRLLDEKTSSKRFSSVVSSLLERDKRILVRASDDYLRCVLAKSISEVYRKVTPKYRNEAARRQFFKKLVDITGAIHLTESTEQLHGVMTPASTDDVATWVYSELERLVAQKVDLSAEYAVKLNSARVEFRALLRQLENITGVRWEESDRFRPSLSINSFFLPDVFENEDNWRWGSQWFMEQGILNINPPVLFFDVLRKGVLAREAAILLSPLILDSMERAPRILCEQAEYLSYKLIERKVDKELWSEARHGVRQQTRFRGQDLVDFFEYYEMMVGDSLYQEVWSRLKEFGAAHLAIADYYTIFTALAARPSSPRLEKQELQLLTILSKKPNIAAGDGARQLGVSIPTAMKAIRDLSTKAGIRFTVIVDMQKLGLVENLVHINPTNQTEVLRILSRFPYCRQVFRTYGSFDAFSVFDIPEEHERFARGFLDAMVDRKLVSSYKLLRLDKDLQSVNFDQYNVNLNRWDIHWDSWGIRLRESLVSGETSGAQYPSQPERFQFDKLDLSILSYMQINCRTPFSTMARHLGVSGAYIGKKVARMMHENVFRYAIWPLKIGAEDWAMVGLSCSRQTASSVARYLSWLPAWRGGLVAGDFEGLLAMVWCPNGELKQLFKVIDDRLVKVGLARAECMNPVGEWVVGRWLPVDPYPWDLRTEDGKWQFDEQRYMALLG